MSAEQDPQVLLEDLAAVLNDVSSQTAIADPRDQWEIDVRDVIQEMMRPWERPAAARNYLNPQIVDVRAQRRAAVKLSDCPVCDGRRGIPTFEIHGMRHQLLTCESCGLGRLDPLPSLQEIAEFYPAEYYGSRGAKFEPLTEAVVRVVGTIHVRTLSRQLSPGSRILDVGCGRGVLLGALADRGHEVHGMDVSETAVAGADSRAAIRVAPCLTKVGYPDGHFDQVILWHVLEHLRNPRELLREVRRILKPGGQVIVAVPNFSSRQARWAGAAWFHLDLPRHLFHFPVAGLRRLLDRTGFDVIREQHFSLRQNPFGWVQSALNKSDGVSRNTLYHLLHNRCGAAGQCAPEGRGLSRWNQRRLRAAYLAGMPLAVLLSLWDTALRSGASICLVGRAE
ncbi:MAG: class I SAM-dependent methyltransferase [Planctomycetaceae bacterium]